MPLTHSNNVTGQNTEQPEYSVLWHPYAIDPTINATTTIAIGSVLQFNSAGVGTNPGPGGDAGATPYTVAYVDLMSTTAANNAYYAGICIGTTSLGQLVPYAPSSVSGNYAFQVMAGVSGLMQVQIDGACLKGDTLTFSTTVAGSLHDTGATTITATTVATAMQTLIGAGLAWCRVGFMC